MYSVSLVLDFGVPGPAKSGSVDLLTGSVSLLLEVNGGGWVKPRYRLVSLI